MSNPLTDDLNHVLDHTRDLWEEIRGERIFLTGGTGFFGCWLLESFLWANERLRLDSNITVLTRSPQAFAEKAPHLAHSESVTLLEGSTATFAFPAGRYAYILHAATETRPDRAKVDPLTLFDANLAGTRRLLEMALGSGTRKFLFTSSGAVYGKQPSEITHIPEDYAGAPLTTEPGTAYGQSKRAAEFLCAAYAENRDLQVKIARCFAFVGPGLPLDANYAIGNFLRDALGDGPILVMGDGTAYRSFLYAADLTIWLWTILFRGQTCWPYNVGSEDDLSIGDLAREVAHLIAPQAGVHFAKRPTMGSAPERYVPLTQRARDELGLRTIIKLPVAIQRTANWHLNSPSKGPRSES